MTVHCIIRALALTIGLAAYAHDGRAVIVCPDAATDGQSGARAQWQRHNDDVQEALRNSPDPRDRALAAFAGELAFDDRVRAEALARSAADTASDDMLVQWVALRRAQFASGNYEPMLGRLMQHEPDNAAVWLEVLVRAVFLGDHATADDALARMAQSSRFDARLTDLSNAWSQAFARFPDDPERRFEEEKAYTQSMSSDYVDQLVVRARPAFEPLFAMCRVDPDTGSNLDHASACASIARLVAASGDPASASAAGPLLPGDDQPAQ